MLTLRDAAGTALIVAHNESTELLEDALQLESLSTSVVRGPYLPGSDDWSASTLCLVNHTNPW